MKSLGYSEVDQLLDCDPHAGKLFWKSRPAWMFKGKDQERIAASWNSRYAGTEAFTAVTPSGYRCGAILGHNFQAHRVIWLLATGSWPSKNIDHINGDKLANGIANLRDASQAINQRNARRSTNNTSGVNGVYLHRNSGLWHARIWVNRRVLSLGYFHSLDEAEAARLAANKVHGYTDRHGVAA